MYDVRGYLFYMYTENFSRSGGFVYLFYRESLAIVLYQFDTVRIEYTAVIPSNDLQLFNPLSAFALALFYFST